SRSCSCIIVSSPKLLLYNWGSIGPWLFPADRRLVRATQEFIELLAAVVLPPGQRHTRLKHRLVARPEVVVHLNRVGIMHTPSVRPDDGQQAASLWDRIAGGQPPS